MSIVMNMSGYEIEREANVEEHDGEVLRAGWPLHLPMVYEQPAAMVDKKRVMPFELADVDVDAFLQQMYRHQR